jgi:hypothetical protein
LKFLVWFSISLSILYFIFFYCRSCYLWYSLWSIFCATKMKWWIIEETLQYIIPAKFGSNFLLITSMFLIYIIISEISINIIFFRYILSDKSIINKTDYDQRSALHIAVAEKHEHLVKYFLEELRILSLSIYLKNKTISIITIECIFFI